MVVESRLTVWRQGRRGARREVGIAAIHDGDRVRTRQEGGRLERRPPASVERGGVEGGRAVHEGNRPGRRPASGRGR